MILFPLQLRRIVECLLQLMSALKELLKKSFLFPFLSSVRKGLTKNATERRIINEWNLSGRPVPPPQLYKQQVITRYASRHRINVFIESGTYKGDTTYYCRNLFTKIYSIELDSSLFERATQRFEKYPYIKIVNGDSGEKIEEILKNVAEPCLFWLDGHYSEGITAKGDLNTPVLKELTHIFNHQCKSHVILIDDARCFIGKDDYPSIPELKNFIFSLNPDVEFYVEDDIIRISKKWPAV